MVAREGRVVLVHGGRGKAAWGRQGRTEPSVGSRLEIGSCSPIIDPMYRPRVVANALLKKANSSGAKLTHLKLQKLVFFLHAWNLALHDKPLVSEQPEAWPYGPVFSTLYSELKSNGSRPIEGYIKEIDPKTGREVALAPSPDDTQFWSLVDQVWDRYSRFTATQLSTMSHVDGGPWSQARKDGMDYISNQSIADFYRPQLVRRAS